METKRSYQLLVEKLSITCKLVIIKKLVNNENLNKIFVFIISILSFYNNIANIFIYMTV